MARFDLQYVSGYYWSVRQNFTVVPAIGNACLGGVIVTSKAQNYEILNIEYLNIWTQIEILSRPWWDHEKVLEEKKTDVKNMVALLP